MKYNTTHRTYRPDDMTSTGWLVESNRSRARLTRRSRWQGSRSGQVYTCKISAPLDSQSASDLSEDLDNAIADGVLEPRKGFRAKGFTCQSTGYIVR